MARLNLLNKFLNSGPLLLLYYLSISEIDTNLEKAALVEAQGATAADLANRQDKDINDSIAFAEK